MTRTARLRAFAKLNLGLRVLYPRQDGFHELRTVFQTVSLADTLLISLTPAARTEVTVEGSQIPDNIIVKAATLILKASGVQSLVQFHLRKHIPAGAGLGGGSSDAASVLLALPVLTGKHLPFDRLSAIAAELGSDVPFFLEGGTALGLGRGEELYPLHTVAQRNVLLVAPDVHSSTAEAYSDVSKTLRPDQVPGKLRQFQDSVRNMPGTGFANDFEDVVFARHPELRERRDRLRRLGASTACMTGSGSALFGIFDDPGKRSRALAAFSKDRSFAVSFLSRNQYRAAWKRALLPHIKGDEWPPRSLYAQ